MSDLQELALVVAALYLSECCFWIAHAHRLFRKRTTGKYSLLAPSSILGNERAGLLFARPLPPLGRSFVCGNWLVSLDEQSAYSFVAAPGSLGARPPQLEKRIDLNESGKLSLDAPLIRFAGQPFLDAGEPAAALYYFQLLRRLGQLPLERRGDAIDRELRRATSADAVRRTVRTFVRGTALLRTLCHAMLLLLAFVGVMALDERLTLYWPPYLVLLAGCLAAIDVGFFVTHRRLYPESHGDRWRSLATLILPTMAVRACDHLSRPLLTRYHPLAAAAALCDRATFESLARRTLLDHRQPFEPACPSDNPADRAVEAAFRLRLNAALQRLVQREGLDLASLLAPPTPEAPGCISYCPRCDRQYLLAEGACSDCGGVTLVRFAAATNATDGENADPTPSAATPFPGGQR